MSADRSPPTRRQRLGAYAVLVRDGNVLLTQLSDSTSAAGRWTLPGGGVAHGEDPRDAVVREVHEETGLHIDAGALLDCTSVHFEGISPDGVREDYHGVRLVYAGTIPADAPPPRVVELGGTTVAVGWHPVSDVWSGSLDTVDLVSAGLEMLGRALTTTAAGADVSAG
ncbi:hypothetical protein BH20ACT6_BH20ACT6_09010 [soil metagenome]